MKNPLPSSLGLLRPVIALYLLFTSLSSFAQDPPAPPSDLTATPDGTLYRITLSWVDNSNDETEFQIVREDPEICCQYYSVAANTTTFIDTDVLPNVAYHYTLYAVNENGGSDEVNASATIVKAVPPEPADFIAAPGPLTYITITFTDNSDVESYFEIQHSVSSDFLEGSYGSTTVTGGAVGSTVSKYINDEPFNVSPTHIHYSPGTGVSIRVRAVINDNGHLIFGPYTPIAGLLPPDYPARPNFPGLGVENGQITFWWNDSSDNEAAFFVSRYKDNVTPIEYFVVDANENFLADPTAEFNTQYTYRVQPLDAYEVTFPREHWFSLFAEGRYTEITGSVQKPLVAPTDLTAMGTSPLHFRVTFTDTNDYEDGYDVHFYNPEWYEQIWTVDQADGSGSSIQTEPSFDFGQSVVYIQVRAFNYDPNTDTYTYGPFSETVTATALESFPVPPSDFTAVPEGPYIRLNWTDNSDPGDEFDEAYFIIMRADDAPVNFNTLFTLPPNTNTFLDTTVLAGHTYAYALEAKNEFDQGNEIIGASATAAVGTLDVPLATLATFVTSTTFTANWRSVEGADEYRLYLFNAKDSSLVSGGYNQVSVNDTTVQISGLLSYRKYLYRVKAMNAFTESEFSNTIRVAPVKDLTLRTVCSQEPATYRRWKIINNNPFAVPVTWYVLATGETGTTSALPGESYFQTQTAYGDYHTQINYTRITWLNDNLVERSSVKSSTKIQCSETFATGSEPEIADDENDLIFMDVYPNPASTTFTIRIATPYDDEDVNVEIVNLQGQRMHSKIVAPNNDVEVNASHYPAGMYVVKVSQGSLRKMIKLVKE